MKENQQITTENESRYSRKNYELFIKGNICNLYINKELQELLFKERQKRNQKAKISNAQLIRELLLNGNNLC